jgi:NAD+ kinase
MIELETFIDDDWATTYNADALVIASATGSTAYALALGGPILPPQLKNILILPAAPHLSMDRPIVLAEGARVEVIATPTRSADVMLTADGMKIAMILPEDRVRVQASERISRFVRLRGRNYFYRSLLDRLEPRVQRSRNGDSPDAD